jgi:hypothetical protein
MGLELQYEFMKRCGCGGRRALAGVDNVGRALDQRCELRLRHPYRVLLLRLRGRHFVLVLTESVYPRSSMHERKYDVKKEKEKMNPLTSNDVRA